MSVPRSTEATAHSQAEMTDEEDICNVQSEPFCWSFTSSNSRLHEHIASVVHLIVTNSECSSDFFATRRNAKSHLSPRFIASPRGL